MRPGHIKLDKTRRGLAMSVQNTLNFESKFYIICKEILDGLSLRHIRTSDYAKKYWTMTVALESVRAPLPT